MSNIVTLLIVEDDDFDFKSMERTLREGENGQTKLAGPFIIFLDLKMPRLDGHGFLKEVRSDAALKDATIFIFTSSDADEDIKSADEYKVAGFILKSDMKGSFTEAVESLNFSWGLMAD